MRRLFIGALSLLVAGGCQSYERQPLDLDGYLARWEQRLSEPAPPRPDTAADDDSTPPLAVDDGVARAEAERIALMFNPSLRRARARVESALAQARFAGLPDDPIFEADALRILDSVDEPWIVGAGLGFTIPLSGRLEAQEAAARAASDAALVEVLAEERDLLASVRTAWIEWSAGRRHLDLLRSHLEDLAEIKGIADRLVEAGELNPPDVRVLEIDRLETLATMTAVEGETDARRLRLMQLLGLHPRTPVDLQPSLDVDAAPAPGEGDILDHPRLALARARYEEAEQKLRREILKQYPDLTLGPAYEWEEGQSRLGLGFGFPLPIFNANRGGIAEARTARDAARLEAELALEELTHRAADTTRKLESARARRKLLEEQMTPLIQQQIEEIRRLADLGELNVLLLENALVRSLEMQQQILESRSAEAAALIERRSLMSSVSMESGDEP